MVDNTLVHFKTKENFKREKGNIQDTSIAFIKDSKLISTHDTIYNFVNWNVLDDNTEEVPQLITFTVTSTWGNKSKTYQVPIGTTWELFINGNYDNISPEGFKFGISEENGILYISAAPQWSGVYFINDVGIQDIINDLVNYTYKGEMI